MEAGETLEGFGERTVVGWSPIVSKCGYIPQGYNDYLDTFGVESTFAFICVMKEWRNTGGIRLV